MSIACCTGSTFQQSNYCFHFVSCLPTRITSMDRVSDSILCFKIQYKHTCSEKKILIICKCIYLQLSPQSLTPRIVSSLRLQDFLQAGQKNKSLRFTFTGSHLCKFGERLSQEHALDSMYICCRKSRVGPSSGTVRIPPNFRGQETQVPTGNQI